MGERTHAGEDMDSVYMVYVCGKQSNSWDENEEGCFFWDEDLDLVNVLEGSRSDRLHSQIRCSKKPAGLLLRAEHL